MTEEEKKRLIQLCNIPRDVITLREVRELRRLWIKAQESAS